MPVASLSAPIFLTLSTGIKVNNFTQGKNFGCTTLHRVRTLDALLLGFDTITLISLRLLENLPSRTWAHEQNFFYFSFS